MFSNFHKIFSITCSAKFYSAFVATSAKGARSGKFLVILVFSFLFLVLALPAFAQNTSTQSPLVVTQTSNYSSTQKRDTDYVKNIVTGLSYLLVGDPNKIQQAVIDANSRQDPTPIYASTGALGQLTYAITILYSEKPISGINYLAQKGSSLGIITEAHAQGFGFTALTPINQLWQAMRNLAYIGFVIVFVITGLMIMFRARIDPRTVASIADSLPRIVIALILVTFSYALSGFVVDAISISTHLIGNVFAFTSTAPSGFGGLIEELERGDANIFDLMKSVINPADLSGNVGNIFTNLLGEIPIIGGLKGLPGIETVVGGLFAIILEIAIIFSMFRVFIMLLGSLVTIILLTIFSPLQFLVSALPGRGGVLSGWGRAILSAALVFPVTFTMLLLAAIFAGQGDVPWRVVPNLPFAWHWFPAPLGGGIFDGASSKGFSSLIAIGILLTTPQAAGIVQNALGQRPAPWAGAAGQELAGAARRVIPLV